jgi:hypothetical protein
MSTEADIAAAATYWKRTLKPEPSIEFRNGQPGRGEMTWVASYSDMATWLPMVYPGPEETFVVQGQTVTRNVPLKFPDDTSMLANGLRVKYQWGTVNNGPSQGVGSTHEALVYVTVNFEQPPFGLTGDEPFQRIGSRNFREDLPVDPVFADGTTPAFEVTRPVTGMDYTVSVFDAPNINSDVENYWANYASRVNSDNWRGFAPGYVIYDGPEFDHTYKFGGVRTTNYTLHFRARAIPWTQIYKRDGTLAAYQVGGSNVIGTVPFSSLWR